MDIVKAICDEAKAGMTGRGRDEDVRVLERKCAEASVRLNAEICDDVSPHMHGCWLVRGECAGTPQRCVCRYCEVQGSL